MQVEVSYPTLYQSHVLPSSRSLRCNPCRSRSAYHPEALVEQLASPGRMFIPVGTHTQHIYHVDKDENGKVTKKEIMGVSVSGTIVLNLSR